MRNNKIAVIALTFMALVMCAAHANELDDGRKDALVKIFNYNYTTCYEKTEGIIKKMPKASIYAKNEQAIFLYYIDPNTTPVGVYFTEIDPAHTRVEISSQSTNAKNRVADNVFSETVINTDAEKSLVGYHKNSKPNL